MAVSKGITGIKWSLISIVIDGDYIEGVVRAKADIFIDVDTKAYGHGGCNRFFIGYTLDDEGLRFGPVGSTKMYCEKTMEVEAAFFRALEQVKAVSAMNESLILRSEDGSSFLLFLKGMVEGDHRRGAVGGGQDEAEDGNGDR